MDGLVETPIRSGGNRARGIQIELGPDMTKVVDAIKAEKSSSTRAEVIRRAISIYKVLLDEERQGREIEIVDEKTGKRWGLKLV